MYTCILIQQKVIGVLKNPELVKHPVPSVLEPPGLSCQDGKRPDGVTTVPWKRERALVWDVTVVDALAPSRIASFVRTKTTSDAGKRKIFKNSNLIGQVFFSTPRIRVPRRSWSSNGNFCGRLGKGHELFEEKEEEEAQRSPVFPPAP